MILSPLLLSCSVTLIGAVSFSFPVRYLDEVKEERVEGGARGSEGGHMESISEEVAFKFLSLNEARGLLLDYREYVLLSPETL